MSSGQEIAISVYEGPNLIVPFAAAIAEFSNPYLTPLATDRVQTLLGEIFNLSKPAPIALVGEEIDFPSLAAALALSWQETDQPQGLSSEVSQNENGLALIAVGYFNAAKGRFAVRSGVEIANAVFARAADPSADISRVTPLFGQLGRLAHTYRFGTGSSAYIMAAKTCGIPVYELAPGTNALSYGQGARSVRYSEATNEGDSVTGYKLAQSKADSNQLIKRIGFPGVEHEVVRNLAAARRTAAKLGAPLVVKPLDRNGAMGVSVGIENNAELELAFATASRLSQSGSVLVERFVPGDEYRLTVFGGEMLRASRLVPASITGDGEHSIAEIIATDNIRRRKAKAGGDYVYELSIDDRMIALLRKQGFTPQDRPPQGKSLRLSGTSNLKTGGHREDVTDIIHHDNVAMAEAIAQNFRLDAAGVDFITPDITKSWTENPCAIIEVNPNPGTGNDMALVVMRTKFPRAEDGRIPSILVLDGSDKLADQITKHLSAGGKCIGRTNATETFLAGQRRFAGSEELPARILGLLLDAMCEALVVNCTPLEIAKYGLPHTKYDLAIIPEREELTSEIHDLLTNNATKCIVPALPGLLDEKLISAIGAL
ncbi:MAG: hypothetical protein V3S07_08245 [Micropepsaceae bacterium]